MANIRLSVDDARLKQALQIAPEKVVANMHRSLQSTATHSSNTFKRVITDNRSVDTSFLRSNIRIAFSDRLHGDIRPIAKYAPDVEYGTPPHFVPPSQLRRWAKNRGLNEYAVSKSIARKGTRAHPFLDKTKVETERYAVAHMQKTMNKTFEEIL